METYNVLQIMDTILKLLQLGNTPKAIQEIEGIIAILNHEVIKKQGKL